MLRSYHVVSLEIVSSLTTRCCFLDFIDEMGSP